MHKKSLTSRLYLMYLIALIPLILFGFYKNGLILYHKGYVDFLGMLKPLIIILMSVTGSVLAKLVKEYKKNKLITYASLNGCKKNIIEGLLIAMVLPLNTSPLIVFIIAFVMNLLNKLDNYNRVAITFLCIELINYLLGLSSFQNPYENSTILNYDGLDLFIGFNTGGICSTSILLVCLGLLFLSFNKLYKKDLVIASVLTFLFLGIVPNIISETYEGIFSYIFGYNILFTLVFVAPNLYSSSYTYKGQVLYGIILGVLTYFISIYLPYEAAMLAIVIINPLKGICDRLFLVKDINN